MRLSGAVGLVSQGFWREVKKVDSALRLKQALSQDDGDRGRASYQDYCF